MAPRPSFGAGKPPGTLFTALKERELGRLRTCSARVFPPSVRGAINAQFNEMAGSIISLGECIEATPPRFQDVEYAVGNVINRLLDNPNPEQVFVITPYKKQERELFVALGGMDLLMRIFEKPFLDSDARKTSQHILVRRSDLINEVLVIIREIAFAVTSLSVHYFSKAQIVFLFTLLSHDIVFENTMNLLEEVLACRPDTFSLSSIPNFSGLVEGFSPRQLAHFCRVLSLVLFEPEDRQMMEGSQVLRSLDLLQLRRDRMARVSNAVERNQVIILEIDGLLDRFVQLVRLINYGPQLADMIQYNIAAQPPLTSDLLRLTTTSWEQFRHVEEMATGKKFSTDLLDGSAPRARAGPPGPWPGPGMYDFYNPPPDSGANSEHHHPYAHRNQAPPANNNNDEQQQQPPPLRPPPFACDAHTNPEAQVMSDLLRAFSPSQSNRGPDVLSLQKILWLALELRAGVATAQGENLLLYQGEEDEENADGGDGGGGAGGRRIPANFEQRRAMIRGGVLISDLGQRVPLHHKARQELQFHSMLIAPHQVELLFVLCTLLSGRRKIEVQRRLARLGMSDSLLLMFDRLSWEKPPFSGVNPLEHIHGPGCECNPESALRVQFMRLVHNFFDRDFVGNEIKALLLGKGEAVLITEAVSSSYLQKSQLVPAEERGLLTRIMDTLQREPPDSVYRFWLSSCLEAYLRGAGQREQLFVARAGVLAHTADHIMSVAKLTAPNLQTAFDLLGEVVKNNQMTLEMMEEVLTAADGTFTAFMDVVMANLVDSNVFLRSLYLSLETVSEQHSRLEAATAGAVGASLQETSTAALRSPGYLTHSWIQFGAKLLLRPPPPPNSSSSSSFSSSSSAATTLATESSASSSRQGQDQQDQMQTQGVWEALRKVSAGVTSLSAKLLRSPADGGLASALGPAEPISVLAPPPPPAEGDLSEAFFTPPEAPRFKKGATAAAALVVPPLSTAASKSSSSSLFSSSFPEDQQLQSESRLGLSWDGVQPPSISGWSLPDGLFGLGVFLMRERETVLLRLMETVTVRTVNHENICCLNTALLMLVLAHRRGHLATVLAKVRRLADEKVAIAGISPEDEDEDVDDQEAKEEEEGILYAVECGAVLTGESEAEVEAEAGAGADGGALSPMSCCAGGFCSAGTHRGLASKRDTMPMSSPLSSSSSLTAAGRRSPGAAASVGAGAGASGTGPGAPRGGERVMLNFRELLWFWREYYLRRGRDRLSIEFSSRIAFPYWVGLVDILCKDDGSPSSLLSRPPLLPFSPYCRPSRVLTTEY